MLFFTTYSEGKGGKKLMKKTVGIILIAVLLLSLAFPIINSTKADSIQAVVSLGADLTQEQREQMLNFMNVNPEEVNIIEVTNQEEANYLKDTAAANQIGSRAISSAYVEELKKGQGIQVQTHNITWVSEDMYENALVTAGVKDAKIIAAAPFKVSGTAALTGIMKAFETITGEKLDENAKKIANEEMVVTGELGEELGNKEDASELVKRVKEEVIERGVTDPEEIKKIIVEIQHDLNINLNEEQIQKLIQLMDKIKGINIDVNTLKEQVSQIGQKVKNVAENNEEVKGILGKITDFVKKLLDAILNIFQ